MVMWEVFTATIPFPEIKRDSTVMMKVVQGARPRRPVEDVSPELSDTIWSLMEACWDGDRDKRPPISQVISGLEGEWGLQSPLGSPSADDGAEELANKMSLLGTKGGTVGDGHERCNCADVDVCRH